jgi:hypothetical protein
MKTKALHKFLSFALALIMAWGVFGMFTFTVSAEGGSVETD